MSSAAASVVFLTVALFATVLVLPAVGAFRHRRRGGRQHTIAVVGYVPEAAGPLPPPPAPCADPNGAHPYRHPRRIRI